MTSLLLAFAATPAFAAKFQSTSRVESDALHNLRKVAKKIAQNQSIYGDASKVEAYNFTREESEENLNTAKQLNYKRAGVNSGDKTTQVKASAANLAHHLLSLNEEARKRDVDALADAFADVKADKNLVIFDADHADEDGSWRIIDVIDTKNDQVVLIVIGFTGT